MLQASVLPALAADMDKLNQELDSQPQAMDKPNLAIELLN